MSDGGYISSKDGNSHGGGSKKINNYKIKTEIAYNEAISFFIPISIIEGWISPLI